MKSNIDYILNSYDKLLSKTITEVEMNNLYLFILSIQKNNLFYYIINNTSKNFANDFFLLIKVIDLLIEKFELKENYEYCNDLLIHKNILNKIYYGNT